MTPEKCAPRLEEECNEGKNAGPVDNARPMPSAVEVAEVKHGLGLRYQIRRKVIYGETATSQRKQGLRPV